MGKDGYNRVPVYAGRSGGIDFNTWRMRIRALLDDKDLLPAIDLKSPGELAADATSAQQAAHAAAVTAYDEAKPKKKKALRIITEAVDDTTLSAADYEEGMDPQKLWDNLVGIYQRGVIANQPLLDEEWLTTTIKGNESALEYTARLRSLMRELKACGTTMTESQLVTKLLSSMRRDPRYEACIIPLQQQPASAQTFEHIMQKLQQHEAQSVTPGGSSGASEQANNTWHQKSPFGGNFDKKKGGKGGDKKDTPRKGACHNCHKVGHWARECRSPKKNNPGKGKTGDKGRKNLDPEEIAMMVSVSASENPGKVYWDSGASSHMSPTREWFHDYRTKSGVDVKVANHATIACVGVGNLKFHSNVDGKAYIITLYDVLHVPSLTNTLLSGGAADDAGVQGCTGNGRLVVTNSAGDTIMRGVRAGRLYRMCVTPILPEVAMMTTGASGGSGGSDSGARRVQFDTSEAGIPVVSDVVPIKTAARSGGKVNINTWHQRLGHVPEYKLKEMSKDGTVAGMHIPDDATMDFCEACKLGKQQRHPFPKGGRTRATEALGLVHSDVEGPFQTPSLSGALYYVTFIDDKSGYTSVYFMKQKSEVLSKLREYKAMTEAKHSVKIQTLRSDNGGEYTSTDMSLYLQQHGIRHEQTVPYTPQQNGVAERAQRTIVEATRCMLKQASLGNQFWAEAAQLAVYIKNVTPSTASNGVTPWELWHGEKPDVSNLRTFGCTAYAHVPDDTRRKLDDKSRRCIYLGPAMRSKGDRLWDPVTRSVVISRDVEFAENASISLAGNADSRAPIKSIGMHGQSEASDDVDGSSSGSDDDTAPGPRAPSVVPDLADDDEPAPVVVRAAPVVAASTAPKYAPRRTRQGTVYGEVHSAVAYANLVTVMDTEGNLAGGLEELDCVYLTTAVPGVPHTIKEAMRGPDAPKWKKALVDEYNALVGNETWRDIVPLPAGRRAVGFRWVLDVKRDTDGNIVRYKVRGVARGFSQEQGIDYEETFSPVANFTSFRVLFAIAAAEGLATQQLDIVTAFLYGELDEEIYMRQPEGFEVRGKEHYVCRLVKSIYGLKQSARVWNIKLNEVMTSYGFERGRADLCVYVRRDSGGLTVVAVHVDDMLVAASTLAMCQQVQEELDGRFKTKALGEPKLLLGVQVERNLQDGSIKLHQAAYISATLETFKMSDCKAQGSPLAAGAIYTIDQCPTTNKEQQEMRHVPYAEAIGQLLWIMRGTRPDIAQAVGVLCRFTSNPGPPMWEGVKRVLRYLQGTKNVGIVYKGPGKCKVVELCGYSDSDFAGDVDNRKSTSGYIYTYNGGAVTWSSKLQDTVALSTTEAEYIGLCNAIKEGMWLRQLYRDIGYDMGAPTVVCGDNQASIALIRLPGVRQRTKHIDVRYHYVRERVEEGDIIVTYISTVDNVADICTKALPRDRVEFLRKAIGMA